MPKQGQDGERIVARLRPHGRALFWPSVVFIAVIGAAGYFQGSFPLAWENALVPVAAALVVVLLWLLPLLSWLGKRYIITTRRIILRREHARFAGRRGTNRISGYGSLGRGGKVGW
ncbi:MAG: hypothetical protein ABI068_15480 [Ktedonobacterales bacterium]